LRLEAYFSTKPPASGQDARFPHSHEDFGGTQRIAPSSSEESSSPDSIRARFGIASFPQGFSAAAQKRFSAGLRRRATPQRITMHGLLPAQRVATLTLGNYHSGTAGECCTPQSPAPAHPGGVSPESRQPSLGVGHPRESSRSGGKSPLPDPATRTVAIVSKRVSRQASSMLKLAALGLIRLYQVCISPAFPACCRFYPSCSAYAYQAIDQRGVRQGVRLALSRLLRCRPWGGYGYDPAPENRNS